MKKLIFAFMTLMLMPSTSYALYWKDVRPVIEQRVAQLRSEGKNPQVRITYASGVFTADIYCGEFTGYTVVPMNTRRMTKMYYKPDKTGSWTPADATYIDKTVYSDGTCTVDANHTGDYSGKPSEYSVQGWWLTTLWTAPGGYYPQSSVDYAAQHSLLPELTGYDAGYDFCMYKKYYSADEYMRGKYGEYIDSTYTFTESPDCAGANPSYQSKAKAGDDTGTVSVNGGGPATDVYVDCQYKDCIENIPGWALDCNPPPPMYCPSFPCVKEYELDGVHHKYVEKFEFCCYILEHYVDGVLTDNYSMAHGIADDMDDAFHFEYDSDISGGGATEASSPEEATGGRDENADGGFDNITSGGRGGGGFGGYSTALPNMTGIGVRPDEIYEAKGQSYREQVMSGIHSKLREAFPISVVYGVTDYFVTIRNSFSTSVKPTSSFTFNIAGQTMTMDLMLSLSNILEPVRPFILGAFYFMFTGVFMATIIDLIKHR